MQEPKNDRFNEDIQAVENRETTAATVDNDHSIDDVRTQHQLNRTSDALAKEKTKRHSKPALVLLLALVMAALGAAAGIAVYKAYFEKQPATPTTTQTTTVSAPKLTAASLISGIKPSLKGTPVETGEHGDFWVGTTDNFQAYAVPQQQPSGYAFTTVPTELSGVSTSSTTQSTIDADVLAAKKFLESKGLRASKNTIDPDNKILGSVDYVNDDVACTVSLTNYTNAYQSHIGCADMASYAANAATLKPMYTAYVNKAKLATKEGIYMGLAKVTDSPIAGYKRANVSTGNINTPVGGAVALFYQTQDKTWHYFTSTQSALSCTDYPAGDIRKAFAGETCMDGSGNQAKVTP